MMKSNKMADGRRASALKPTTLTAVVLQVCILAIGITACSDTTETITSSEQPAAIQFDTYIAKEQNTTRTTYPNDTKKQGEITADNNKLHETGFGVFATFTDAAAYDKGNPDALDNGAKPNFMYNQEVSWSTVSPSTGTWTYTPVKYWPNDYSTGDVGGGATGSKNGGKVSFFAYAPFMARPSNIDSKDNDGILNVSSNSTGMNHMLITYRAYASNEKDILPVTSSEGIDLLWAIPVFDATKQDVNENVSFFFKHALSKLNIKVQGVFDEVSTNSNDVNSQTRILIESVSVSNTVIPCKGYMNLEPAAKSSTSPKWRFERKPVSGVDKDSKGNNITTSGAYDRTGDYDNYFTTTLSFSSSNINANLLYTSNPADKSTAAAAWDDFSVLPTGVTKTATNLLADDKFYMFPPNTDYDKTLNDNKNVGPITVNVVYYVITYDPKLVLNTPKYFSIVKNDITRTLDTAFTFDAGKEYTLLLKLGMTSVKCEATYTEWEDGDTQTVELP